MSADELTRRLPVGDVELAWDRWGPADGRPLVLCHGYSGSAHDFSLHVEALAAHRPVIALDHRGHGRSTALHDLAAYTVDHLTDDFVAFLDVVAPDGVDLLGHSMGGLISLGTALRRPDLVRSLILMDTSGWSFAPEDDAMRNAIASFLDAFDPTAGLPDLTMLAGPEDALVAEHTSEAWRARKAELSASFDPWALKGLGIQIFGNAAMSVRPRLGELAMPVSVIVGQHDRPFVGQAAALAAETGGGPLTVIAGAYHSPQLTHQDEWRAAVEAHLAAVHG